VLAAVEAAATGDRNRRHDDLRIALEQGLRPLALDALERLAAAAWQAQIWAESVGSVPPPTASATKRVTGGGSGSSSRPSRQPSLPPARPSAGTRTPPPPKDAVSTCAT
jgi:hypothetical protein